MRQRALAVCGWDDAVVPGLIEALDAHGLRAVRIADHSGAALVRARRLTGLPCALHPAASLRGAPLDAILLAAPGHAAAAVDAARHHRAALIVTPETLDADSIRLVADAAAEDGLVLAALRPAYRSSGLHGVVATARNAARGTSLLSLDLDLAGPDPRALIGAAIAAALRVLPGAPASVVASTWGSPTARGGIALALRYADGALATVDVRRAESVSLRASAEALDGPLSLRRPAPGPDALRQEARAALTVAPDRHAAALLRAEAAVLFAVEAAIETGQAIDLEPVRPPMRLVPPSPDRDVARRPRVAAPRLHLVVS